MEHEPKCRYFGRCGGCTTQHIPYELQLKNKLTNISRFIGIEPEKIEVFHEDEYNYRNRMDFVFHEGGLGLREREKWYRTVDVQRCEISDDKLNSLLSEVREHFKGADAFNASSKAGTFRYAVIRTPSEDSTISFILNSDSGRIAEARERIIEFSKRTTSNNVVVGLVGKGTDNSISPDFYVVKGSEYLKQSILGKEFFFHSQGFFQNNTRMAERMVSHVKELLREKKGSLLDNYGGVGLFGISCSEFFNDVTIIESDPSSIECANKNITHNHLKNARAMVLDADNINRLNIRKPLHVINDPPRSGMSQKALERLIALEPETIIYISCNPQQFAKELPRFQKRGYELKSAALFDLFPQTNHIEMIVHLEKNAKQA